MDYSEMKFLDMFGRESSGSELERLQELVGDLPEGTLHKGVREYLGKGLGYQARFVSTGINLCTIIEWVGVPSKEEDGRPVLSVPRGADNIFYGDIAFGDEVVTDKPGVSFEYKNAFYIFR
ncbi:MAG: hypothetical protein ABIF88_00660 [archaeon]